jgi:Zn-dependent protease with chaperone function
VADRLVVVADSSIYAFCAGLISPRIYVSEGLLTALEPPEIAAVIHHEAAHLKRRDPLLLLLSKLVGYLAAPLPVLRTLIARIRIEIELAADSAALAAVPVDALAGALL